MEEFEDLKRIYIDKEKENLKLKEELSNIKGKYYISEHDKVIKEEENKVNYSPNHQFHSSLSNYKDNDMDHNNKESSGYEMSPFPSQQFVMNQKHSSNTNNVKFNAYNYSDNYQYQSENHQIENLENNSCLDSPIPEDNREKFFSTKTAKAMDLGRIYDEAIFRDKLKINKNSILEVNESNQVRNYIIKDRKDGTYGKIIEQLSNRKINELKEKNENLELINQDLSLKLKIKEDEKKEIKESYESELKLKNEIYTQNMSLINKTHQEEIKKMRLEYEMKMDNLIKNSEEEKIELAQLNAKLEKENYTLYNKINSHDKSSSDKADIIEFQKKYLSEMKLIQKEFIEYKEKTTNDIRNSKTHKEELINKLKTYKDAYKKIKDEHNNCENKVIESDLSLQISFKELVKGHESLKIELELKKNEIKYLKNQVSDLEKNEKILKSMLVTKKISNEPLKLNDLVNYNNTYKTKDLSDSSPTLSPDKKNKNESLIDLKTQKIKISRESSIDDDEISLPNKIDLKKARQKIEEMEEHLKALSEENELLKKKFYKDNYQTSPVSHREHREIDLLRNTQISYKSNGENRILRDSKIKSKLEDKKKTSITSAKKYQDLLLD